ncbi:MAG: hypothetical protein KF836_12050 [Fimbriimonadaceae bacterium]|nr:hypothetical protein [Fimbriimonadaceae bacterium]
MKKSIWIALLSGSALAACTAPTTITASAKQPLPIEQRIQREHQRLEQSIEFHKGRVQRDPKGAIGFALLAETYLDKARTFDDDQAAIEAERAARKSLEVRRKNNTRASNLLTKSLLAQHRFADAYLSAADSRSIDPNDFGAVRLQAEVYLELGKYEEFQRHLPLLNDHVDDPSTLSVLSRWAEISGHPDQAIGFAKKAVKRVEGLRKSSPNVVASFETSLGTTLMKHGNYKEALEAFESAYNLNPMDYRAMAGMTRTLAQINRPNDVIKWGEKCRDLAKLTDVTGLVAMAYTELGNNSKAEELFKEMDRENDIDPSNFVNHTHAADGSHQVVEARHTHNRLYASVMADAGRNLAIAHHVAEGDLDSRKDIYAYDCFAWATFRYWEMATPEQNPEGDGLLVEAKAAMKKAMATGCKDIILMKHAQRIESAKRKCQSGT